MADQRLLDRFRGALLGTMVGEALGMPLEGKRGKSLAEIRSSDLDHRELNHLLALQGVVEGTLEKLDRAIEKACEEGEIRFSLVVSRKRDRGRIVDCLSLEFKDAREEVKLDGLDLRVQEIAKLAFDRKLVPIDPAFIARCGTFFYADSRLVLSACRSVVEQIIPFEVLGKVTIFGTDYFWQIGFPRGDVPRAPGIYHTDHELSIRWKKYLLDFTADHRFDPEH